MKKWMFFCLLMLMIYIYMPTNVLAVELTIAEPVTEEVESVEDSTDLKFEITGGIDTSKKSETTFDKTRTITGNAEKDTVVSIQVYFRNVDGELDETGNYELSVGASGIFSQSIDLMIGTNVVHIAAEKDGKDEYFEEYKIKRKSEEIKKRLDDPIVLPGGTTLKLIK